MDGELDNDNNGIYENDEKKKRNKLSKRLKI